MNTTKREPEIEEGLLKKQEEAQKEPNPAKSEVTLLQPPWRSKQVGIWKEGGKPSVKMMKRWTGFLKGEVHMMMNRKERLKEEGEVQIVILNQVRRPPIKGKAHFMKMSQGRRLPRGYCDDERDETMLKWITDSPSRLDSTLHSVPVTEGGITCIYTKGGGMW